MADIDPRFIDVDFPSEPQYVAGYLPLRAFDVEMLASYADEAPVYPESEWQGLASALDAAGGGCDSLVTRIYDQKQEGSCVANATSQSHEIVQCAQFGKDRVVHLSAMSLYKRIGSSPQSGAVVSDGLKEMSERGILPLDDEANKQRFKHTMPNTGWSTPFPSGWEETAKQFKAHEFLTVRKVEELVSALFNQHPVVVGRQGHSICYCRPAYKDGKLVVKYANSWGSWGDQGFGYDTLSQIRQSADWAFSVRSVTVPGFQFT